MHSKAAKLILDSGILTEIEEAMEKSLFEEWRAKTIEGSVGTAAFALRIRAIPEALAALRSAIQMYTDTEGKDGE